MIEDLPPDGEHYRDLQILKMLVQKVNHKHSAFILKQVEVSLAGINLSKTYVKFLALGTDIAARMEKDVDGVVLDAVMRARKTFKKAEKLFGDAEGDATEDFSSLEPDHEDGARGHRIFRAYMALLDAKWFPEVIAYRSKDMRSHLEELMSQGASKTKGLHKARSGWKQDIEAGADFNAVIKVSLTTIKGLPGNQIGKIRDAMSKVHGENC